MQSLEEGKGKSKEKSKVGDITGIVLETIEKKDRYNSPERWENKQLKMANIHDIDKNKEELDFDDDLLENDVEIESRNENAPFLKGR